jgi:hypothetical protein
MKRLPPSQSLVNERHAARFSTTKEEIMIRVLVIGSMLLIAQAVPAFAEKITLACSRGEGYITLYYTFDMKSRAVLRDPNWEGGTSVSSFQISDDELNWIQRSSGGTVAHRYNRPSGRLQTCDSVQVCSTISCVRAQAGPL